MTDKDLLELRRAALEEPSHKWGKWTVEGDEWDGYLVHAADGDFGQTIVASHMNQGRDEGKSTANFIAAFAPPTALALVDALGEARLAIARVRVVLSDLLIRGEDISERENTGSINSERQHARGEGYVEAAHAIVDALEGILK